MDYYHRHSRSIFWELEQIVPMGNNCVFRFIFGWMQPIKIGLLKLTQTAKVKELYEKNHLIQDLLIPVKFLKQSIDFFDSVCRIYPIWICPFVLDRKEEKGFLRTSPTNSAETKDALDKFYVDIGLYGVPGVKNFDATTCTRAIEEKCRDWNGFQMSSTQCSTTICMLRCVRIIAWRSTSQKCTTRLIKMQGSKMPVNLNIVLLLVRDFVK